LKSALSYGLFFEIAVDKMNGKMISELSRKGYWPAIAMEYYNEGKYSRVIELCNMRLKEYPDITSGRVVLARAYFHSGQIESSEKEFHRVLRIDPDNMVALKYLGDIRFKDGDESSAFSYYGRVQKLDPRSNGLTSELKREEPEETRVLSLKKGEEKDSQADVRLRDIPFRTETVADLLLKQGHPRMAINIFEELTGKNKNPRIVEKLERAREALNRGKGKNV